ncbi:hypothetical protein AB0M95_08415 [Sphaerisporangium sp. NPDC051017]|uniref:effector-associated constant component EACC1 n=1 Tax=Sphaerisporangium sp. NPDC051017 TaxID=3154636 RepID=UPI00343540E0
MDETSKITITLDGDVADLYRWLRKDPEVTRDVPVRPDEAADAPGEMGVTFEAVVAVVGDVLALGSLLFSVRDWRAARDPGPAVTFERNGVVITLKDDSPETIRHIMEVLSDQADQ